MNTDEEDNKRADFYLDLMIKAIRNSQHKGGFDNNSVLTLVDHWIRVGKLLRTPVYASQAIVDFIRSEPVAPVGNRKPSEVLFTALQNLMGYPTGAGIDPHIGYFVHAEKAIIAFVDQYRRALGQRDPAELKAFIARVMMFHQAKML